MALDATDIAWGTMSKALAEMPAGSWTTYGDVAALIGSHPVPVGVRLANHSVPNPHRVLQADGKISPSFRWLEPGRVDDPVDLLRAEGVIFDEHDRADPAQRLSIEDLAQLAGLTIGDLPETGPMPSQGQDPDLRDRFVEQLAMQQSRDTVRSVLAILDSWTAIGADAAIRLRWPDLVLPNGTRQDRSGWQYLARHLRSASQLRSGVPAPRRATAL